MGTPLSNGTLSHGSSDNGDPFELPNGVENDENVDAHTESGIEGDYEDISPLYLPTPRMPSPALARAQLRHMRRQGFRWLLVSSAGSIPIRHLPGTRRGGTASIFGINSLLMLLNSRSSSRSGSSSGRSSVSSEPAGCHQADYLNGLADHLDDLTNRLVDQLELYDAEVDSLEGQVEHHDGHGNGSAYLSDFPVLGQDEAVNGQVYGNIYQEEHDRRGRSGAISQQGGAAYHEGGHRGDRPASAHD